jgi:hypothetical protein
MSMITTEEMIQMTEQDEQSLFKLATVVGFWANGTVKIQFDGEEEPSEKEYAFLASYKPYSGDRVLVAKVSNTYVILGSVRYKIKPLNYITSNMADDVNGNMNINYMYVEPSTGILHVRRKNGQWTSYNPR